MSRISNVLFGIGSKWTLSTTSKLKYPKPKLPSPVIISRKEYLVSSQGNMITYRSASYLEYADKRSCFLESFVPLKYKGDRRQFRMIRAIGLLGKNYLNEVKELLVELEI
jgi:hypothetical protein